MLPIQDLEGFLVASSPASINSNEIPSLTKKYRLQLYSTKYPGSKIKFQKRDFNIKSLSLHIPPREFRRDPFQVTTPAFLDGHSVLQHLALLNEDGEDPFYGVSFKQDIRERLSNARESARSRFSNLKSTLTAAFEQSLEKVVVKLESSFGLRLKKPEIEFQNSLNENVGQDGHLIRKFRKGKRKVRNKVREEAERKAKIRAFREEKNLVEVKEGGFSALGIHLSH